MSKELWIKEAIPEERKGKYRESVRRRYGKRGFTRRGTIKVSIIEKDLKSPKRKIRKEAQLARTLRGLKT